MTLKEKALDDVLGRVEKNILPVLDSEQDANGFLGASIAEALPWLISVPSIRAKIPKMVTGMLPSGIPATAERVERLATQLLAVVVATRKAKRASSTRTPASVS